MAQIHKWGVVIMVTTAMMLLSVGTKPDLTAELWKSTNLTGVVGLFLGAILFISE